jgi:hypothetical protein
LVYDCDCVLGLVLWLHVAMFVFVGFKLFGWLGLAKYLYGRLA